MNIMKEIEKAVNNEEKDAAHIVANLKKLGIYMFTTNTISKDMVVSFCSGLRTQMISHKISKQGQQILCAIFMMMIPQQNSIMN